MNCQCCNQQLTPVEVATYRNRCEDCWCYRWPPDRVAPTGAARCYSSYPEGRAGEVTHGANFYLGGR